MEIAASAHRFWPLNKAGLRRASPEHKARAPPTRSHPGPWCAGQQGSLARGEPEQNLEPPETWEEAEPPSFVLHQKRGGSQQPRGELGGDISAHCSLEMFELVNPPPKCMLGNHKSARHVVSFQTPSRAKQFLELQTNRPSPMPSHNAHVPGFLSSRAQQAVWFLILVSLAGGSLSPARLRVAA